MLFPRQTNWKILSSLSIKQLKFTKIKRKLQHEFIISWFMDAWGKELTKGKFSGCCKTKKKIEMSKKLIDVKATSNGAQWKHENRSSFPGKLSLHHTNVQAVLLYKEKGNMKQQLNMKRQSFYSPWTPGPEVLNKETVQQFQHWRRNRKQKTFSRCDWS